MSPIRLQLVSVIEGNYQENRVAQLEALLSGPFLQLSEYSDQQLLHENHALPIEILSFEAFIEELEGGLIEKHGFRAGSFRGLSD
jgi:hypothetical protein